MAAIKILHMYGFLGSHANSRDNTARVVDLKKLPKSLEEISCE